MVILPWKSLRSIERMIRWPSLKTMLEGALGCLSISLCLLREESEERAQIHPWDDSPWCTVLSILPTFLGKSINVFSATLHCSEVSSWHSAVFLVFCSFLPPVGEDLAQKRLAHTMSSSSDRPTHRWNLSQRRWEEFQASCIGGRTSVVFLCTLRKLTVSYQGWGWPIRHKI